MIVLVTGAAGFIGSTIVDFILKRKDWDVICVDKLSYASNGWSRLEDMGILKSERLKCITWDLVTPFSEGLAKEIGDVNIIIHMAAETHVDRSIKTPVNVIHNNIMSTVYMLEYARTLKDLKMFQYFSTDEVFGPADDGVDYKEWDRHNPTNPYSASKAASEDICLSYKNTYKIPLLITNLMNVYGQRQHNEKFIPLVVNKLLNDETIDIHVDEITKIPGSRYYVHLENVADAILFILDNGLSGEKYNIKGEQEVNNLELAQKIAKIMGKELKYTLISTCTARPGHDNRYSLDGSKLSDMGWSAPSNFHEGLESTIKWMLEKQNKKWLKF